jgi:hypothetical protein
MHMSVTTTRRRFAAVFSVLAAATIHAANAQPSAQSVGFLATLGGQVSSVASFNSAGGTNTVAILGTGLFLVTFPGLGNGLTSNVQVNAFETNGTPHICTSQGWGSSNGTDVYAYVGCFDFVGNPYSADFSIFYQARQAAPGGWLGFFWADQPSAPSYTPNTNWNYNNRGGTNTVTRTSTGVYTATFPGLRGGGNPQVTAYSFYGGAAAHCEISSWTAQGTTTAVGVLCFDGRGNPADEYYSLSYNRSALESEGATNGVYGYASKPSASSYTPKFYYSEYGGLYPTAQRQRVFGFPLYSFVISDPNNNTVSPIVGMVTAVGTAGEYCEVEGYDDVSGLGYFDMNLACYDSQERQINARYSAAMFYQVH